MSYMKQALLNICWCCKGSSMCVLIQHWLVPVDPYIHTCTYIHMLTELNFCSLFSLSRFLPLEHHIAWLTLNHFTYGFLLLYLLWICIWLWIWNIACSLPFHLHFFLWLEESFKTLQIAGCKIAAVYSKSGE